jgi:hypothetical protein
MRRVVFLAMTFFSLSLCAQPTPVRDGEHEKIGGLNLVSLNRMIDSKEIDPIVELNANWSAIIPFAFVSNLHQPSLSFESKFQWIGERKEGIQHSVRLLHARGLKVMIKPQLWVGHGDFTGHIEMHSEADWQLFEQGYLDYMLAYAHLASQENVEMLCIGTELTIFTSQRPEFWSKLIDTVRFIYPGKLTYAANWDGYENVPFWEQMDYIGIDAYFPLVDGKNPNPKKLKTAWKEIREVLAKFAQQNDRKIIFTEYGYRSTSRCAEHPWDYNSEDQLSEKAQLNALNSLYETIWQESFFVGGFLWKWYPDDEGRVRDRDHYSVQDKEAEELVRTEYAKCRQL